MSLDQLLTQAGFNRKEVMIYLMCLSLGTQRASLLARKCGLKRSTGLLALQRLVERGYLSSHREKNVQFFTAVPPKKILERIGSQKKELETLEGKFGEALPEFEKLIPIYEVQPKVSFFNGIEGIKIVMEDTLTTENEILCYSNIEKWFETEKLKDYIIEYEKVRVKKKKIPLRAIDSDNEVARKYLGKEYPKNNEWTQIRWLPKEILPFTNEINIYDKKLAICSLDPNELLGVIIESESITKTQRSIFELGWKVAQN